MTAWCGTVEHRWNAGARHMNQALPNYALTQMGLVSFLAEHQRLACPS